MILMTMAWRNLWRKKRRTIITISSVVFATVLAIGLMSLLGGTTDQFVASIVENTTGHLQIQDALYHDEPSMDHALEFGDEVRQALAAHAGDIRYAVPRIQGICLAARDMASRVALVMGIDPDMEDRMNGLPSRIVEGRMFRPDDSFAVVAEGLAGQLEVAVGDTIVLLGQGFQGATAAGQFEIGGIVRFPLPEQNNLMIYLPLEEAQGFFSAPGRLTNLILMAEDESGIPGLAGRLRNDLDDEWYAVMTWQELMPDAVAAFKAREAQFGIFTWVLYIVVGFGIFGTILTMMYERLREFGILLAIGLKRRQLAAVCMLETLLISFSGVLIGAAAGFPIIRWLHRNPVSLGGEFADAYLEYGLEPYFHFSTAPEIFLSQGTTIFIIAVLVGLYPAIKVLKLNMVEAAKK